ncbi:MAG: phospho-N-acetylmuramoyl-pentapeptide-transferase, partial [Sphingobacteriales bacterium]
YIILMLVSTIWLGLVGFLDDYIKVFRKNKEGLAGRFKIMGQIGLGIIVGLTMYYNQNVMTSREIIAGEPTLLNKTEEIVSAPFTRKDETGTTRKYVRVRTATTTIPFLKSHEFSYAGIGESPRLQ